MRTAFRAAAAAAIIGGSIIAVPSLTSAGSQRSKTVIEADSLAGVTAPYTGAANAIRGVPGGGAPWVIARGDIEVTSNGKVHAKVKGLVIDPNFPNPAVAGINPVPFFKVTVSCLSTDASGAAVTMNVSTASAPADTAGNAEIEGTVSLPSPCFAPIAFVANGVATGNGAWFAVTGA